MIWGTYTELKDAYRRLKHFEVLSENDGPFTALTPFGRNLALFFDFGGNGDHAGDLSLLAGAGSILASKCDANHVRDSPELQREIGCWFSRLRSLRIDMDMYLV